MTVSPTLMHAILAMDSYNRGYNEGISGLGGIEFTKIDLEPEEIFNRTISLANYLLSNGAVLGDGDSVGLSATEKIRVRHTTLEPNNIPLFQLTLEQTEGV